MVTDAGRNMINAVERAGFQGIVCTAHKLHLVVGDAIGLGAPKDSWCEGTLETNALLNKCRKIVRHFSRRTLGTPSQRLTLPRGLRMYSCFGLERLPASLLACLCGGEREIQTRDPPLHAFACSKMLAGCAEGCYCFLAFLVAAPCLLAGAEAVVAAAKGSAPFHAKGNAVHSNAIKILPPETSVASVTPALGGKHAAGESHQGFLACASDEDCNTEEFCPNSASGGVHGTPACLACRRRRKRCFRDAMCCSGNYCYHGMCVPLEHDQQHPGEIEESVIEYVDHGATDFHPKRTTSSSQLHHLKGQEGAVCLCSSDCAEGLCCAQIWSKICKPVLMEGQVCTKHRKKGAHGLEIFQWCNCGDGLTFRLQKDHTSNSSSRLHTCQRH
ncbi:hypothetical protein JRQ81_017618 [Phrynocephalus forsythii]|uniref:Dickkopf N-terminal cysteine-rich domain-containing protein n=1 Tax=Phrynocephalus forsythii TaxID=171643 RepID=A0A9Q1B055_9SAUR|nr:hypothetical protein JRQ81_017618 [Phrynocephalus forsythii]